MGWNLSMVVIKSEKSINEKEFLESLGYQNLKETEEKTSTIAALTDLSQGTGKYPLIRIAKVYLPKEYLKPGTKLAIAGAFQRIGKYPFWNYF